MSGHRRLGVGGSSAGVPLNDLAESPSQAGLWLGAEHLPSPLVKARHRVTEWTLRAGSEDGLEVQVPDRRPHCQISDRRCG
jgi:hypothetical protein